MDEGPPTIKRRPIHFHPDFNNHPGWYHIYKVVWSKRGLLFDVFVPVCDDTAVHFAVSRTFFLSVLFLWITVLRRASDAIFERKSL